MSFAQELTPAQAVLAYLWGESTHSYASQPEKAGETVRIVGTDPFIIGSRAKKVNRLYEILMTLSSNYPGKLKCMQYNTGGMGEIIETYEENGKKKKRLVRKVKRIPINLMAQIQRGDVRGINKYEKGRLGTRQIVKAEGQSLEEWDPKKYYSEEEIRQYIHKLVQGRREFTQQVAEEGLKEEVIWAAERSFRIDKSESKSKVYLDKEPGKQVETKKEKKSFQPKTRPKRGGFWRH
jgi:phosphoenolpyruvate carboxykinase (ATP)